MLTNEQPEARLCCNHIEYPSLTWTVKLVPHHCSRSKHCIVAKAALLCRFVEAKYPHYGANMPGGFMKTLLRQNQWHTWALSAQNMSAVELAMSKGPQLHLPTFHRMQHQAVTFVTETKERRDKKAVDGLVLTWFTESGPDGRRLSYIGRAQLFMQVIPPWAIGTPAERQEQALDVVQAKWYTLKGYNPHVYGAPVYSSTTKHETQGNLWRCDRSRACAYWASSLLWRTYSRLPL